MVEERITVQEAARRLGVKEDAIRKRIQRGTLRRDKDPGPNGRVYVYLDTTHDVTQDTTQDAGGELVEELRDRVRHLEHLLDQEREARTEERRRHDMLLAQLMQRLPELEAPTTSPDRPPGVPGSAGEPQGRGETPAGPETGAERRPWWRRVFGG